MKGHPLPHTVALVLALAIAGCGVQPPDRAWILWAKLAVPSPNPRGFFYDWHPEEGYRTLQDCQSERDRLKKENMDARLKDPLLFLEYYKCLPDTVDAREYLKEKPP
jgi:hypothetical protein